MSDTPSSVQFSMMLQELQSQSSFLIEQILLEIGEAFSICITEADVDSVSLASAAGVTPKVILMLLKGSHKTTIAHLVKVAHALGCTVTVTIKPK